MEEELKKAIESVAKKATETKSADEALKFTQSAVNACNALNVLVNLKK